MPARRNQNLSRDEAARLRAIAESHGLLAPSGLYAGRGSALALQLALIHGDAVVVSLDPDDRRALAEWMLQQPAPEHLAELVRELANELTHE